MRRFVYFAYHGTFDQPPRGNPITNRVGEEQDAGGYENWNERVTAESYRTNAEIGNFERISFNVGETMMAWLRRKEPQTYATITAADASRREKTGYGTALGNPFVPVILPLMNRRDKITQLQWGWEAFKHHFGRDPIGLWLPELAVDHETLSLAREIGYQYTILAHRQIKDHYESGGPYRIELPDGGDFTVFVRTDSLSNDLSFNIDNVGGAGYWARNKLSMRAGNNPLTLLATEGETFGHHHLGEEKFLYWLMENEARAVGYQVVTLDEYHHLAEQQNIPTETVEILPFTSWSSTHQLDRWIHGTEHTQGTCSWKAYLRLAVDQMNRLLTAFYHDVARSYGVDPWMLRNRYIHVWLGDMTPDALLAEHASGLTTEQEQNLITLLQVQLITSRSYSATCYQYDEFDRSESRYAIANMAYALDLAQAVTQEPFGDSFRNALAPIWGGQAVYDRSVEELGLNMEDGEPAEITDSTGEAIPEVDGE